MRALQQRTSVKRRVNVSGGGVAMPPQVVLQHGGKGVAGARIAVLHRHTAIPFKRRQLTVSGLREVSTR